MRKTVFIGVFLALLAVGSVSAGDIARFVNLGFSESSEYFLFAQYGLEDPGNYPYAELYCVNVPRNEFVRNGVQLTRSGIPASVGTDGVGALFGLVRSSDTLIDQYGVDHLRTGRILYLLIDGESPRASLSFRDFEENAQYAVELAQSSTGEGSAVRSRFHVNITVTPEGGTARTYRVGRPEYDRNGVRRYTIRQVILAPSGNSLILVIEKEVAAASGVNIRYMVETVRLR